MKGLRGLGIEESKGRVIRVGVWCSNDVRDNRLYVRCLVRGG